MQGFRQVNLNPVFLIQLNGQAREFPVRFGGPFIEADGLNVLLILRAAFEGFPALLLEVNIGVVP